MVCGQINPEAGERPETGGRSAATTTSSLRVLIVGQKRLGLAVFEAALAHRVEVVGVLCPTRRTRPDPLWVAATRAGVPIVSAGAAVPPGVLLLFAIAPAGVSRRRLRWEIRCRDQMRVCRICREEES